MFEYQYALSTVDNPFNPFEDFASWYKFDVDNDYNSSAYLMRITKTSDQLSDKENNEEINRAIDEILKYDFRGIYIKVKHKLNSPENA